MVTISIDYPNNKMKLQKQNKTREVLGLLKQPKQKLEPFLFLFLTIDSSFPQMETPHFAIFLLSFNTQKAPTLLSSFPTETANSLLFSS